jgi:hypothetical protein
MYVRRREKLNEEDGVELLNNQSIILVTDLLLWFFVCIIGKNPEG